MSNGKESEFIQRWEEFLTSARDENPALISAGLIQDEGDPGHFVSFAEWEDAGSRKAWKNSPSFSAGWSACRALCDDFYGSDYERVVDIRGADRVG